MIDSGVMIDEGGEVITFIFVLEPLRENMVTARKLFFPDDVNVKYSAK